MDRAAARHQPRSDPQVPDGRCRPATEAAGGTDVATHLATGNVRLTSSRRSAAAVASALEQSYAADRGFEVPTVVLSPAELAAIAAKGRELEEQLRPKGKHYVTVYDKPPSRAAIAALEALDLEGERCVVAGRAAYALLDGDIHTSRLLRSKAFAALGVGTSRTLAVLEALVAKWA